MGEIINQYELLSPFQNQNAGFSKWTIAVKRGREYFLKQFLDPVYPTDDSISEDTRRSRILDCEDFEKAQTRLYSAVNNASRGNTVRIAEFFRYDNHYYMATERILGQKLPVKVMPAVPFKNRFLICKTIAYEMMHIHHAHIVHADIKESNIIIQQTQTGRLVGKVIDFGSSFFEDKPPASADDFVCDQLYLAPESCKFLCEEPVRLTCKIDVFALGLLFHQYLTGNMPEFNHEEYDFAFDAVLDGQNLRLDSSLSTELQVMIQGMLAEDPDKRLTMDQVYSTLDQLDEENGHKKMKKPEPKAAPAGGSWFYSAGDL